MGVCAVCVYTGAGVVNVNTNLYISLRRTPSSKKMILILLLYFIVSVEAVFDCRRPSGTDLCLGDSTCDSSTGNCTCPSTTNTGYNCGLVVALINADPCNATMPCQNGGTCMGDGTDTICYCSEDFVGDNCELPRYGHTCGEGEMTVAVTPFGDFSKGLIYFEGDPDCTLTEENGRYSITLPHTGGNCSNATASLTEDERWMRRLLILYDSDVVTGRDEVVIITCGSDLLTMSSNISVGILNQGLHEDKLGKVPDDRDIGLVLTLNGSIITDVLDLGEEVTVRVGLTEEGNQRYTAFRIESCIANNNLDSEDQDYRSLAFIRNSCDTTELESVTIQKSQRNSTTGDVSFVFEAFKFRVGHGDQLRVKCVIKLCENPVSCAPVPCPADPAGSPGGFGRRRRAAGDERSLSRVLTIKSTVSSDSGESTMIEAKVCTRTGVTIGVVIVMATVMFVLLVLCIVLIIREFREKRKIVKLDAVSQSSTTQLAPRQSVL